MPESRGTTKIGFLNPNGQLNIRPLDLPGTDLTHVLVDETRLTN